MCFSSKKSAVQTSPHDENRFARYPGVTLGTFLALLFCSAVLMAELLLRTCSGLGNPLLYELNPLFGYRPLPNQIIEPKGGLGFLYAARVTTNNLGLRGASKWSTDPVGKILFLGDSVTYGGQYVADGQLFSSVVGNQLSDWQVGNSGVNAWGVENIVGLVVDSDFVPAEIVVTCVLEADFYRGTTRAASLPLWTERPYFALQDLLMHIVWRINETRYGSSVDAMVQSEADKDKIVDRAVRRLAELDEFLRRRQIMHVICILPVLEQVVDNEPVDDMVRQALQRHGIEAHYLLPDLRSLESDLVERRRWFHDIAHLEPAGHAAYGELIGRLLAQRLPER